MNVARQYTMYIIIYEMLVAYCFFLSFTFVDHSHVNFTLLPIKKMSFIHV